MANRLDYVTGISPALGDPVPWEPAREAVLTQAEPPPSPVDAAARPVSERTVVAGLILAFWAVHVLLLAIRTALLGAPISQVQVDIRRLPPTLLAIALSF